MYEPEDNGDAGYLNLARSFKDRGVDTNSDQHLAQIEPSAAKDEIFSAGFS